MTSLALEGQKVDELGIGGAKKNKYSDERTSFADLMFTLIQGGEPNISILLKGDFKQTVLCNDDVLLGRSDLIRFLEQWPSLGKTWQEFAVSTD